LGEEKKQFKSHKVIYRKIRSRHDHQIALLSSNVAIINLKR